MTDGRKQGIYVASRAAIPAYFAMWRCYRDAGYPVISTWIDKDGPVAAADRGKLLSRCLHEASSCAAFVLYIGRGDLPLRIAYAEWGAAMAAGAVAYVVCDEDDDAPHGRLWDHSATFRCATVDEAMRLALRQALSGIFR